MSWWWLSFVFLRVWKLMNNCKWWWLWWMMFLRCICVYWIIFYISCVLKKKFMISYGMKKLMSWLLMWWCNNYVICGYWMINSMWMFLCGWLNVLVIRGYGWFGRIYDKRVWESSWLMMCWLGSLVLKSRLIMLVNLCVNW